MPINTICVLTPLTYEDFLNNISTRNEPFLVEESLTSSWRCLEEWYNQPESSRGDRSSSPNFGFLRARYGDHIVQVADIRKRQFNEFERTERPFKEVIDLWTSGRKDGRGLYVKDWHMVLQVEEEGGSQEEVYTTPDIFKDDWMTHHALSLNPRNDYRFTYMGPAGTFTPLHRDVYGSYSWSTNVIGRKRWCLIPPELTGRFRKYRSQMEDEGEAEMIFDLRDAKEELLEGVSVVQQEAGQTIFVPSGWYHQVENLDFCISINQNFANSATISNIYRNLLLALRRVEDSIEDVKPMLKQRLGDAIAFQQVDSGSGVAEDVLAWEVEWAEEVQKVLEMDAGWGLSGFWDMVLYNLKNPGAASNLRPTHEYVISQLNPIILNYRTRSEWKVLREIQRTVLEVEEEILRLRDSRIERGANA